MEKLTNQMIAEIAIKNQIDPAALLAVREVESNGSGFFPTGKPKILFEGHIFYRFISKSVKPDSLNNLMSKHPNIIYQRWDRSKYFGGDREYIRLNEAIQINRNYALQSTSWGMFQIMGSNYRTCCCKDVEEFVGKMKKSEEDQLILAINFLKTNKLIPLLNQHNWASFARAYNGPGYASNKYDLKLSKAFLKYKVIYR